MRKLVQTQLLLQGLPRNARSSVSREEATTLEAHEEHKARYVFLPLGNLACPYRACESLAASGCSGSGAVEEKEVQYWTREPGGDEFNVLVSQTLNPETCIRL